MPIWNLEPIDTADHNWRCSDYAGTAIVRAPDDLTARAVADGAFSIAALYVPGAETPMPPWGYKHLVSCERLETSETLANKLSGDVYHIGQGSGFSLFVDTGNGIVAAGGYPGLSQRLQRFREETGSHQPLAYQVVTHHHQDHLGGIGEALDLGARLVTVSGNVATIKRDTRRDPESGRFLTIDQQVTLGSGSNRVEVYEVSTLHAASYLLVYTPGSRTPVRKRNSNEISSIASWSLSTWIA